MRLDEIQPENLEENPINWVKSLSGRAKGAIDRRRAKKLVQWEVKAAKSDWNKWVGAMGKKQVEALTVEQIKDFFATQNYHTSASEVIDAIIAGP